MEKYGNGYDTSRRLAFNSTQAEPTPSEGWHSFTPQSLRFIGG